MHFRVDLTPLYPGMTAENFVNHIAYNEDVITVLNNIPHLKDGMKRGDYVTTLDQSFLSYGAGIAVFDGENFVDLDDGCIPRQFKVISEFDIHHWRNLTDANFLVWADLSPYLPTMTNIRSEGEAYVCDFHTGNGTQYHLAIVPDTDSPIPPDIYQLFLRHFQGLQKFPTKDVVGDHDFGPNTLYSAF
jgi:hypothetical protein